MGRTFARAGSYALIVCATFAAYLPALHGGMLWDDSGHVTRAELQPLRGLWLIWSQPGATQQYYPLLHSAFWLEHALWGGSVEGYHLLNIALHALAACLLVAILRRLAVPGATLAGLCFALHPICVEAVAWISEQKSVLSGVFYLAAALVYLGFADSRKPVRYFAASALFVLALLSKTVTGTLPGALLVVLWWRRGQLDWKRDVRPLAPWFAAGAAAGIFTAWREAVVIGARGAEFALTPWERILLAGRVLWFYAGKIIWPVHLTFLYPRWNLGSDSGWLYLSLAGVLLAAAVLVVLARRHRGPLAAFLFFAGTLFPVLGFFNVYPFRYSFVADHFAYLASLGLIVPAASLFWSGSARWLRDRAVVPAFLLAALLGAATWQRAGQYRDEETLYRATLARNPDAWLAHNNLGNLLIGLPGRREEAMSHLRRAAELKPDFWEAHVSLGNALAGAPGGLSAAIAEYRTAARLAPDSDRAQTNLGNALLQTGQAGEAMAHLETAVRLQPANAEARNNLGNAFMLSRHLPEAMAEYRAALHADPDFAEAHNNLGRALAQSGRLGEAIGQFETAIRLKPDYAGAHNNLGNALSQIPGRMEEAIAEYRAALRIRPDSAPAHNNLGFALARLPERLPEAISEFRQALALDPDSADAHYNLGAALWRMEGQRMEALSEFESALRLKPNPQLERLLEQLRGRRK